MGPGQGTLEKPIGPTRRARKKARTRGVIFDAAMALFAELGYGKVTIEDICHSAAVAKATFFLHFANKAALLEEYNSRLTDQLAGQIDFEHDTAERQLRHIVHGFIEASAKNGPVIREMVREFINQPALPRAAEEANRSVMDLVTTIIAHGQKTGEFRTPFPPHMAAAALVSTWGTIASWWTEEPDKDTELINAQALDIVLNGLKTTTRIPKPT